MTPATPELDENLPRIRLAVLDAETRADGRSRTVPAFDADLRRLFDAIQDDFPVSFVASADRPESDFDGVVQLGGRPSEAAPALPTLVLGADPGGEGATVAAPLQLAPQDDLPRPLRGCRIAENERFDGAVAVPQGARTVASADGEPLWWLVGEALTVSRYPIARLADGEELRSWLRGGRYMGLLPLLSFLEGVLGERGWRRPPLRACFVLDDPNLHRPRYGFADYARLAEHAAEHGYHVALATVPLDSWLVNRRAAAVFAQNPGSMSLLIHGNDHVAEELGRLDSEQRAIETIAQALRRIAVLERRSGLAVDRILAPPHGACSEPALNAMLRLDVEAACISRPRPWLDVGRSPTVLSSWYPADLVAGGMPVLPRYPLSGPREELALRALLGQPLILYGHHGDLAAGLDVFAQAAADVNALGDARWERLSSIARASFATHRLGGRMTVRLHARRVSLEIPSGVSSLGICMPEPWGGAQAHHVDLSGRELALDFASGQGQAQAIAVEGGERVEIALAADRPLVAGQISAPRVRIWPLLRRTLAEGRDRLQAGSPY